MPYRAVKHRLSGSKSLCFELLFEPNKPIEKLLEIRGAIVKMMVFLK